MATRPRTSTSSRTQLGALDIDTTFLSSAEEVLALVPGLVVVQHGNEGKGYQYFLRGFDALHGTDLAITVEGVLINEWSNVHAQGYLDLGFMVPEVIQQVEVRPGPFALEQGLFATAGSAHYEPGIAPDRRGAVTGYGFGTTNRHRLYASYSAPDGLGDEFLALEALDDDGFGQNRRSQRLNLAGRYVLVRRPSLRLSQSLYATGARFGLPGGLRLDDIQSGVVGPYDAYSMETQGFATRILSITRLEVAESVSITMHAARRQLGLDENFTGALFRASDARRQSETRYSLGAQLEWQTALSRHLSYQQLGGVMAESLSQQVHFLDPSLELDELERQLDGWQGHAYLGSGLHLRVPARRSISAGVRADAVGVRASSEAEDGRGARVALSPRVSWAERLIDGLTGFLAYGRGIRPPEARAFAGSRPAMIGVGEDVPDTAPDFTQADSVEAGLRWRPLPQLTMRTAAFGTWISSENIYDHVSQTSVELGPTQRLGVEGSLDVRPLYFLTVSGDVTFVDARFGASQRPVPFAPRWVTGVRTVLDHPSGFRLGVRSRFVAPRALTHGARSSGFLLLDGVVSRRWELVELSFGVENILGRLESVGEYHYASDWQTRPVSSLPVIHRVPSAPRNARLSAFFYF